METALVFAAFLLVSPQSHKKGVKGMGQNSTRTRSADCLGLHLLIGQPSLGTHV